MTTNTPTPAPDLDARVAALLRKLAYYRYVPIELAVEKLVELEQAIRAELQKPALHEPVTEMEAENAMSEFWRNNSCGLAAMQAAVTCVLQGRAKPVEVFKEQQPDGTMTDVDPSDIGIAVIKEAKPALQANAAAVEVQRYDRDEGGMFPNQSGDWVRYEDLHPPVPARAQEVTQTEYCWLVEHQSAIPAQPIQAKYHVEFSALGNGLSTSDPHKAARYATKAEAQPIVDRLGSTFTGIWQAVEHGFEVATPPNATKGDEVSDAERFVWWFTEDESKSEFLDAYLEGVINKWTIDDWRRAIDGARAKHSAAIRATQKG